MKKILALVLILFINISIFAAIKADLSKPVTLQAGYGSVSEFYVEPLATQSNLYLLGMPFSIEDPLIQYDSSNTSTAVPGKVSDSGRVIADWNMLFNKPVNIRIEIDNLMPNDTSYTGTGLTFSLIFSFSLSYTVGSDIKKSDGYIIYDGTGKSTYILDRDRNTLYPSLTEATSGNIAPFSTYLQNSLGATDGLIGSVEGKVVFTFTSESTDVIKNQSSTLPIGEYRGKVRIFMEVVE